MQHHEIAFGYHALDLAALLRIPRLQEVDESPEPLGAVRGGRIVLLVPAAEILRGGLDILAVDGRVVELHGDALVLFERRRCRREWSAASA
jgi:hypothetical protein